MDDYTDIDPAARRANHLTHALVTGLLLFLGYTMNSFLSPSTPFGLALTWLVVWSVAFGSVLFHWLSIIEFPTVDFDDDDEWD